MKKRISGLVTLVIALAVLIPGLSRAETIIFTTSNVKAAMTAAGAPLHNTTNQWGLWAVRVMPIVGGTGVYTITGGSTTQVGWGVAAPNGIFGAPPYTASNSVWFYDESGSEAGSTPANPLYMIMDVPAGNFCSTTFNGAGGAISDWAPGGGCGANQFELPGYDGGAGGTNVITAVGNSSTFSFNFTLGAGATWDGRWQFVVDGSRYNLGTSTSPAGWQANFFGGFAITCCGSDGSPGGLLPGNMGPGYEVLSYTCTGFDPPMDKTISVKKKNRVLPLKMVCTDPDGNVLGSGDIAAPIVQVTKDGDGIVTDPAGDDLLSAGQGTDGNMFVYDPVSQKWNFNLQTKNFNGLGIYTITAVGGGTDVIVGAPTATFIVQ